MKFPLRAEAFESPPRTAVRMTPLAEDRLMVPGVSVWAPTAVAHGEVLPPAFNLDPASCWTGDPVYLLRVSWGFRPLERLASEGLFRFEVWTEDFSRPGKFEHTLVFVARRSDMWLPADSPPAYDVLMHPVESFGRARIRISRGVDLPPDAVLCSNWREVEFPALAGFED